MTATATTEMFSATSLRADVSAARVAVIVAVRESQAANAALAQFDALDAAHALFARIAERAAEAVIDARQALHEAEARLDRWV